MPNPLETLLNLERTLNANELLRVLLRELFAKKETSDPAIFLNDLKSTPVEYYPDYFGLVRLENKEACILALLNEFRTNRFTENQKKGIVECGKAWMYFDEAKHNWVGLSLVPHPERWDYFIKHNFIAVLSETANSFEQCRDRILFFIRWLPKEQFLDFLNAKVGLQVGEVEETITTVSQLFERCFIETSASPALIDERLAVNGDPHAEKKPSCIAGFLGLLASSSGDSSGTYLAQNVSLEIFAFQWQQFLLSELIQHRSYFSSIKFDFLVKENDRSNIMLNFLLSPFFWEINEGLSSTNANARYEAVVQKHRRLFPLNQKVNPVFVCDDVLMLFKYNPFFLLNDIDFLVVLKHYNPKHPVIYKHMSDRLGRVSLSAIEEGKPHESPTRTLADFSETKFLHFLSELVKKGTITREKQHALLMPEIARLIHGYNENASILGFLGDSLDDDHLNLCFQEIQPENRCGFFIRMINAMPGYVVNANPIYIIQLIPFIPEVDHERYLNAVIGDCEKIRSFFLENSDRHECLREGLEDKKGVAGLVWPDGTCFLLKMINYYALLEIPYGVSLPSTFEEARRAMVGYVRSELSASQPKHFGQGNLKDASTFLREYCPVGEGSQIIRNVLKHFPKSFLKYEFLPKELSQTMSAFDQHDFVDIMFGEDGLYQSLAPVAPSGWLRLSFMQPPENDVLSQTHQWCFIKLNTDTLRVTIEQIQNKALVVGNMLHFVTFFTEKFCMFANNLLIRLASLLNFSDKAVFGKLYVAMLHIVKINQYQLPEQRSMKNILCKQPFH